MALRQRGSPHRGSGIQRGQRGSPIRSVLPGGSQDVIRLDDAALRLIDLALAEDRGSGDWTTRWIVPARTRTNAAIAAKDTGIIAGLALASAVFLRLDPRVEFEAAGSDG